MYGINTLPSLRDHINREQRTDRECSHMMQHQPPEGPYQLYDQQVHAFRMWTHGQRTLWSQPLTFRMCNVSYGTEIWSWTENSLYVGSGRLSLFWMMGTLQAQMARPLKPRQLMSNPPKHAEQSMEQPLGSRSTQEALTHICIHLQDCQDPAIRGPQWSGCHPAALTSWIPLQSLRCRL